MKYIATPFEVEANFLPSENLWEVKDGSKKYKLTENEFKNRFVEKGSFESFLRITGG